MVVDGMVQVPCMVASCGLAARWHLELVAAQIFVGTEVPPNTQQVGSFSSMFLCPMLPRTPLCGVSWEKLDVSREAAPG